MRTVELTSGVSAGGGVNPLNVSGADVSVTERSAVTSGFSDTEPSPEGKKVTGSRELTGSVPGVFPITDFYACGVEKLRSLRENKLRELRTPSPSVINNIDAALAGLNRLNGSLSGAFNSRLENHSRYASDLLLADYLARRSLEDFRKKEKYLSDLDVLGEKYLHSQLYSGELRERMSGLAAAETELHALRSRQDGMLQTDRIEDLTDRCRREFNVADGIRKALITTVRNEISRLELKKEESMRSFLERALETQFNEMWDNISFCTGQGIPYSVYARSFGGSGDDEETREMTEHYLSAYLKQRNRGNTDGRETVLSAYSKVRPSTSGGIFLKYLNVVRKNIPLMKMLESLGRYLSLDVLAGDRAEKIYTERMAKYRRNVRGEHISGVTLGDTLDYALPEELAGLSDPDLELLFDIKLINRCLLTFDFIRMARVFEGGKGTEPQKQEEKGPVIICVDTSGSMKGEAEDYGKAVALVLALKCLEASRPCHIINFAIENENITVESSRTEASLEEVNSFLRRSFRGGTSIDNAMLKVSEMIENEPDFARADVLFITDGKYMFSSETVSEASRIKQKSGARYVEFIKGFSDFNKNGIFDRIFVICNNNFTEK